MTVDSSHPVAGPPKSASSGLGTFGGVFTPSILTILGIILFLRQGWVVGSGGLWRALALIIVAHLVSTLTAISLAAIATNRRVQGGGDYYLISRSLGPEFGGSLGLLLFLAQSVSVAFYCFGFGEALASLVGESTLASPRLFAVLAALGLFLVAYVGADLATRFQFVIMGVMGAALVSFFIGAGQQASIETLRANLAAPTEGPGFWMLFAIFFPAVTGFTQGVSMSGDLADASTSLPRGTFFAVGTSLVVYSLAALFFAMGAPLEVLRSDFAAFGRLSAWSFLFHAGVIAATLSSALASFLGAPRILQALARDDVFSILSPFGKGASGTDNPRRAVILTGAIAMLVFVGGNLNSVARVISMFFLISYGLLNWATYVEAHGASPLFRPRFRFFHARLSLVGSLLCLGAMLAIDLFYGLLAMGVMYALYQHLVGREIPVSWADSRPAFQARKLKETLREIERLPVDDWNWLPNLIVFGEDTERRDLLTRFGTMFSGVSGITTSLGIVEGEGDFVTTRKERQELEDVLRQEIENQKLDAFPLAVAAPDLRDALGTILQTWGVGPVRANTVLLDWWERLPETSDHADAMRYGRQLRSIVGLGCHVAILDASGRDVRDMTRIEASNRRIDVWWWESASCRLSLLLAYMMTRAPFWEEATIRILVPCAADEEEKQRAHVIGVLGQARIDAEVVPVRDATSSDLTERSNDACLVFFRIALEGMQTLGPFGGPVEPLLATLPATCLVSAATTVKLSAPETKAAQPERDD